MPARALLAAEPDAPEKLAVVVSRGASTQAVTRELEALGSEVTTTKGVAGSGQALVDALRALLLTIAVVDGLVCLYTLAQALTLTATERRSAIAVAARLRRRARVDPGLLAGAALAVLVPAAVVAVLLERFLLGPAVAKIAAGYVTLSLAADARRDRAALPRPLARSGRWPSAGSSAGSAPSRSRGGWRERRRPHPARAAGRRRGGRPGPGARRLRRGRRRALAQRLDPAEHLRRCPGELEADSGAPLIAPHRPGPGRAARPPPRDARPRHRRPPARRRVARPGPLPGPPRAAVHLDLPAAGGAHRAGDGGARPGHRRPRHPTR